MAMQVVYSAGTSPLSSPAAMRRYHNYSPRASPRSSPKSTPRGVEGWRPVLPGYKPRGSTGSVTIQRTVEVQHRDTDSTLKDAIPLMPRPLAVTCLIFNILLPGLGTFVSGISVLCCSRFRPVAGDKWHVVWVNSWVALLQFLTAFLFLLGWIWSIMWGASFLTVAQDVKDDKSETGTQHQDEAEPMTSHRAAHASNGATARAAVSLTGHNGTTAHRESTAPIIVLQEAPVVLQSEMEAERSASAYVSQNHRQRTLNPYNPRHQRALRMRQEAEVPSLLLSPGRLEDIVLHLAPGPSENHRPRYK